MKTFHSFSSEETKRFGHEMAETLVRKPGKMAVVIALRGDLGAGKTTFTQGFFRGLGIKQDPVSPTFVVMRRYKVPSKHYKDIYHLDAYRLKKAEDLAVLGFEDILSDQKNIILVEWPENVKGVIPRDAVRMRFVHGRKEHERKIIY
jgi:tRNA threonylcarbamoyladenosine biosynthesis protein TsaE